MFDFTHLFQRDFLPYLDFWHQHQNLVLNSKFHFISEGVLVYSFAI